MRFFLKLCLCVMIASLAVTEVFADNSGGENEYVYSYAEVMSEEGEFEGIQTPSDAAFFEEIKSKTDKTDKKDDKDGDTDDKASDEKDEDGKADEEDTVEDVPYMTFSGSADASVVKHGKKEYIRIPFDEGTDEASVSFNLSGRSAKKKGTAIGFGIHSAGDESVGAVMPYINVKVTLSDGESEYYTCVPVKAGTAVRVFADISTLKDFTPESITVSVFSDSSIFDTDAVTVTEPYLTKAYDFKYQSEQGFCMLSVMKGSIKLSGNLMKAETSAGDVSFVISSVPYGYENTDTAANIRYLSVGCSGDTASVTASGLDSLSNTGIAFATGKDTGSAVFRLGDAPHRGTFIALKNSEGLDLTVDELAFHETDERTEGKTQVLASLAITNDKLTGSGRLDYDTVKEYSDCYIGVFMVPAVGEAEPVLVGKVSVASRFSFELSVAKYPHAATDYMYYAAIVDHDGASHKISEPRFVSSTAVKNTVSSLYGLYGVDPVSVYESGTTHVMVDVDICKLMDTESVSNITVSRGGYVFGVNSDYLDELDSHMTFYRSSGVSVYIKLYCSSPIQSKLDGTWLTYLGDGEVMLRPDSVEGANMYMALVSFLCSRYPGISSLVLSSGVNSAAMTGLSYSEIYKSAAYTALAARLIYSAASETSDVFVTLPICDVDDSAIASPELFLSLVAERLMHIGPIPWAVMYTDSTCSLPKISESIISLQRGNNTAVATYSIFCYAPEKVSDTIVEDYKALCDDAASSATRVVFISEKNMDGGLERATLNKLKKEMKSDSAHIFDAEAVPLSNVDADSIKGKAAMWDFSASYSTLGWVSGYGIGSLQTAPEKLHSGVRVLRCITEDTDEDVAGIMLCRNEIPISFAGAPLVEFVYSLESDHAVNTVFVFGNGENRAEFTVPDSISPDADGKYRVVCDLTDYSKTSAVAYVAVIVYSSSVVSFDLSQITAMSTTLDDTEVKELVEKKADVTTDELPFVKIIVLAVIGLVTLVLTIRCYSVVRRRDRDLRNIIKKRRY